MSTADAMSPHTRSVRSRFSSAAPGYDEASSIQRQVADRLARRLDGLAPIKHILDAGCGTGLWTRILAQRFPSAEIEAIDLSPGMLRLARRVCHERIAFHVADVTRFTGQTPYDLVTSSSSLHWVAALSPTLQSLARQIHAGGHLLLAIMVRGTLHELHETRRYVVPAKIPGAQLPDTNEVVHDILEAGMMIREATEEDLVACFASARALLQSLHNQGLTGGDVSHAKVLLTRRELSALTQEYEHRHRTAHGKVPATFRILYVHAVRQN